MNVREAQRRALLAAAKVALFAGAIGCGGSAAMVGAETEAAYDPGPAGPDEVAEPAPAPAAPAATIAPIPIVPPEVAGACGDLSIVTDATIACCVDVLDVRVLDGSIWSDEEPASNDELSCCELVLDAVDASMIPDAPPFNDGPYYACCSLTLGTGDDHPACTPWGPPMPPEMPADLAWGLA
jgi:hypothetical protein